MGLFDRLVAGADAVTTRVMGTRAEILPRTIPARLVAAAPDPSRQAVEVRGVYTDVPGEGALQGQRHGSGADMKGTTVIATASRALWLSAATVAAIGYRPREGDAVRLLDQPDQPVMAIVRIHPSDMGDIGLVLGREPQP